jgi:hypothetical protein
MENPTIFMSYSHDSAEHKNWVLGLSNRLIKNGVNVILDQHDLTLGGDLPSYMEKGLSLENRVICVCSERYVEKANNSQGGVGYEKMIMTGELLKNVNTKWIIPIVRNNVSQVIPKFLSTKLYENFNDDDEFEKHYEALLRDILQIPFHPKPELGRSPFLEIKENGRIIFKPKSEKFHSPAYSGIVSFDYSSNDSRYAIGDGDMLFDVHCSKAGDQSVHVYNDPESIDCIAVAYGAKEINEIVDAFSYDFTSRHRHALLGEIVIWQNKNGYFAATKILSIKNRGSNAIKDELIFEYRILTNGSSDFSK